MKKIQQLLLAVCFLVLCGCGGEVKVDPLVRSKIDGLNKEAFVCRYREPARTLMLAEAALQMVDDSLPQYLDGALRARNNMAFAYYQMSDADSATALLDRVERDAARADTRVQKADNVEIERMIAQLLRARLLQRQCRIADSYRILYDVGRSGALDRFSDRLLYNYAQSEYYITMLVLNFHYRDGKEADVRTLLNEVEARRDELRVDYAEDLALGYALAYGWQSAGESLRALDYCDDNLRIMELPGAFCPFQYANTLQMSALALRSMPGMVSADSVLALYDEARRVFFEYGDPYQMLGGTTSTARYALLVADTAMAWSVMDEWRSLRDTWTPFAAPKMELGYFDLLIRSRHASSADEVRHWYELRSELEEYIKQNEREDFALQQSLASAQRRSGWMMRAAMLFGVMLVVLAVLTVLLWSSLRRLRREQHRLEERRRHDVERIAGVETCLSVLRHDVSPFVGYLRRSDLSAEMRDEVTGQLLRTFDNIKSWTRLSAPGGLELHMADCALQDIFDDVARQSVPPTEGVTLCFEPTPLRVVADRQLVVIMLRNLVSNALQHTAEGSVVVSATRSEGGMVDIKVADTGCGMSAEQCAELFRADRRLAEGSEHGFGLILCRYIIGRHDDLTRRGCKLWVQSQPSLGTTIYCRLAEK